MGNGLAVYIEQVELIGFFSGYPLIYAIVHVAAGEHRVFINRLAKLLPFAYALAGTLYLALVLKDMAPHLIGNIEEQFKTSYLKIWGLLAVLFWIPALSKKPVFSLLHSLVFFFLLLRDFFINITSSIDVGVIKNDMKIYSFSLLLHTGTLIIIMIIYSIITSSRNRKSRTS